MPDRMDKNLIPAAQYKKIVELVPILCVDVVLMYEGMYVLVKRATEPLKGEWWVIGGRAFKGEPTIETAKRKIKEEAGLEAEYLDMIGVYEDHYPKSAWGIPTSSVSVVYLAKLNEFNPRHDKTVVAIKLFDELPERFLKHFVSWQK